MSSPFAPSASKPGHGVIDLALLPPSIPVLRKVSYQYPLKLISPSPITVSIPDEKSAGPDTDSAKKTYTDHIIHTVYILTYGGGIVAGDTLDLSISLAPSTRLTLLTQGSTKIFNTPDPHRLSSHQHMTVDLHGDCGLVYLPDPVQPFALSAFEQRQTYRLHSGNASLCALDWVSEGRRARNEVWNFWRWGSRNEVWWVGPGASSKAERKDGRGTLLLRDNVFLNGEEAKAKPDYSARVDGLGVFGTLILYGPLFESLGASFVDEFRKMPRIGGRKWGDEVEDLSDEREQRRQSRHDQEKKDGVLWTASSVRGFVIVKVGAREVEGVKTWLGAMIREEGSLIREFGERALMCLK